MCFCNCFPLSVFFVPSSSVSDQNCTHEADCSSSSCKVGLTSMERKRQGHMQELIATEETYVADMSIVLDAFYAPLKKSEILTNEELETIFVNWNELLICNTTLLKAFRVRKQMSRDGIIQKIGDILCEHLPHLTPYIRFCSCQLTACAIIQSKTETCPRFLEMTKKCSQDPRTKGMPVSSFLLKPMQRITKYPLLIKKILENTAETHPDYHYLVDALALSEELCSQVNEGVREKENSDRLEFVQKAVNCEGVTETIIFNSLTNCLGPRKFLHNGILIKTKSSKELMAFLFNDFLLLTVPYKSVNNRGSLFALDKLSNYQYKIYRKPIFLNEVDVKPLDGLGEEQSHFQVAIHNGHHYSFRAPTAKDRTIWVRKLQSASTHYRDTEKSKILQKQPSLGSAAKGYLKVIVVEATNLWFNKSRGRSDPYCEVNMGSQAQRTKVINDTINPKWNASMQFIIKDLEQDVLCITVFDRDYFSPNDFLGRTEIRIADVVQKRKTVGPILIKQKLLEVDTGEILIKVDVQLFA